ncbi:MAG: hypothetical protein ACO23N_06130 [Opitutales bacterium]
MRPTLLALLLTAAVQSATPFHRIYGQKQPRDAALVTVAFVSADGKEGLEVDSDEFLIRMADGRTYTAHDFVGSSDEKLPDAIIYRRKAGVKYAEDAPIAIYLDRQSHGLTAYFSQEPKLEAIETERFRLKSSATRGGRGEPVVIDGRWILLPYSPTTLTRHTDGNTPAAYSHRFEKVGNHSFVDFEGADVGKPEAGLVRAINFTLPISLSRDCFPIEREAKWRASAPGCKLLLADTGETAEMAVLDQAPRGVRSFTHYNNWFDGAAKNISGDTLPRIAREFKEALAGTGITVQALVPDNGWQDRKSVWKPSKGLFPNGMTDLAKVSQALRDEGCSLGLWLAPDNTSNDIDWAATAELGPKFTKAQPNKYFSRYFPHLSLAAKGYRDELEAQLRALSSETKVSYFKFDFNHLSHAVPTDRHGHAAEFDGWAETMANALSKDTFINATNWTWHSPAWRNHADILWLLAGDDGFNGNWPELAGRAQATTDRDVYFWRMWGDPADRPWFPISAIMTHGIIRNPRGQMSFKTDTLEDWCDHVLMHYGRGTLLLEWYFLPKSLTKEEWASIIAVHRWTESRRTDLNHACYVGGRPDEGQVYGYIGWSKDGTSGTLVARNPSASPQTLHVPIDAATLFRGKAGEPWRGRQVYPSRIELPITWQSGQSADITVAGYSTVAIELSPGQALGPMVKRMPAATTKAGDGPGQFSIKPAEFVDGRCELLVIGRPTLPTVLLNGNVVKPIRSSRGKINAFAGYARDGMASKTARRWEMASYDLSSLKGKETKVLLQGNGMQAEAWVLAETPEGAAAPKDMLTPLTLPGHRRETHLAYAEGPVETPPAPKPPTAEETLGATRARIELEVFGNNGGVHGAKELVLSGVSLGPLPAQGDDWQTARLEIPADKLELIRRNQAASATANRVIIRSAGDKGDKFKVRAIRLVLTLADGREVATEPTGAYTSHADWTHREGALFSRPEYSGAIKLQP